MTLIDERPTEQSEDALLVRQAKEDCLAFSKLYRRYHNRVYSYLKLRTGEAEEAADLTHQVFVKALDALPRYQERGLPFAAWLMRITRNLAIDAARRRKQTVDFALVPEVQLIEEGANPESALLERERLEELRRAIAELEPDKRDLLALRFMSGLSAREIGLVIGKSEEATKKQITRTLNALKERCNVEMA